MAEGARQLVLELPVQPRYGRKEFLVSSSNESACRFIESWPAWSDTLLQLSGPSGSGKSHLAAIWAAQAGAWTVDARAVVAARVPELARAPALVVEDIDRGPLDEPALFHLVNIARERPMPLLFTAQALDPMLIRTPDLLSRLRLAPSVALGAPDDALLRAVLVKLFGDRQLLVDANVIDYVALRIERSLAKAAEIVTKLDREALSRGRRVTRAIAGELLGAEWASLEAEDEPSS
jgi:chromosomal replication initiation ATPase DnaA